MQTFYLREFLPCEMLGEINQKINEIDFVCCRCHVDIKQCNIDEELNMLILHNLCDGCVKPNDYRDFDDRVEFCDKCGNNKYNVKLYQVSLCWKCSDVA